MATHLPMLREYLALFADFVTERQVFERFWHPEFVQTELPNLLTKNGQERAFEACLAGTAMGRKLLSRQEFAIQNMLEAGSQAVVECRWKGTLALDAGPLRRGQELQAEICMVFEMRDGRIHRQRNYDCYQPF